MGGERLRQGRLPGLADGLRAAPAALIGALIALLGASGRAASFQDPPPEEVVTYSLPAQRAIRALDGARSSSDEARPGAVRELQERCQELDLYLAHEAKADLTSLQVYIDVAEYLAELPEAPGWVNAPAAGLFTRTAALAERHGTDDERAWAARMLAQALADQGRIEQAREVLDRALELASIDNLQRALLILDLADLLRLSGLWDAAAEHLLEVGKLERRLRQSYNRDLVSTYRLGLEAQIDIDLGVPDVAGRMIEDRRVIAARLDDPDVAIDTCTLDVNLALATGHYDRSLDTIGRTLERDRAALRPSARARLLLLQGQLLEELERTGKAERGGAADRIKEALDLHVLVHTERLIGEITLASLRLRDGRLDEARALLSSARGRVEAIPSSGRSPILWESILLASAEARAALLNDSSLKEIEARSVALDRALGDLERHWSSAPRRAGGIGHLHYGQVRDALGNFVALARRIGTEEALEQAFGWHVAIQSWSTIARRLSASCTGDEFRTRVLKDQAGILVFFPTDEHSYVFAVERGAVACYDLALPADWTRSAADWTALLSAPLPDGLDEEHRQGEVDREQGLASRIGGWVLPEPVRERILAWTSIGIVGQELLGGIPFEALMLDRERRLGLELPVYYLPSIPVACALAARRVGAWDPAAGQDSPAILVLLSSPLAPAARDLWPALADIPLDEDDLAELTEAYPRESVRMLRGNAADAPALLRSGANGTRVVHLYGHGVRHETRERSAGLVLPGGPSDGTALWADDLERGSFPPLVVLSTCRPARGPARSGDASASDLSGALLLGGARAVVASAVDVDLDSDSALMRTFHAVLAREAATPGRAMLAGRRAVAADPRWTHPFHWAQAHVFGLGDEPVFEAPLPRQGVPWRTLAGLGSVLGVVLGVALALSRWARRIASPRA